jgi:histidinol-phosphate aminotransferase/imidazoleglycerol-phosphate dehydratase/histidinol-phosphatase
MDALSANGLVDGDERRKIIIRERQRMLELLSHSPFVKKVYPSVANFILIEATNVPDVMAQLYKYGILARDRSHDIANTIRLSVSTPEDNNIVLTALGVTVAGKVQSDRLYSYRRTTKETNVDVTVDLDRPGFLQVNTGIEFFDHMCSQLAAHGGFGLILNCKGDLEIDQHHSVEDCALALGETLKRALGDKRGINRFGFNAPLDEALAEATIDLSGRPYAEFNGNFPADHVGDLCSEMVPHFFRSLAASLGASIHISVKGQNTHHMIEACFKALGRALKQAFYREGSAIPSTKGVL